MPRAGHAQPKPAPRGRSAAAKAKAVAQAKLAAKNAKRSSRRTAVAALNTLAADVGAARAALAPKDATSDAVKLLVMRLQPRCHDGDLFDRLRAATQLYVDGGGRKYVVRCIGAQGPLLRLFAKTLFLVFSRGIREGFKGAQ